MTKIMPVEQCGAVRRCYASPQSYRGQLPTGFGYIQPSNKRVAVLALQKLEEAWAADQATHEKNAAALETNMAVRDRIQSLMDEVGMPKTRRVKSGTRYGQPKYKTVDAGYIEDMREQIPINDGFSQAQQAYERLKSDYDKFAIEAEKEEEMAQAASERAAEGEKKRRRENIEMAKIILRYELHEESTWEDILAALRKKDQRLDLAVAMMQTRSDWSGGFWRVSDAMSRFTIHNNDDKDIANDIMSCMDDDDGRVFRDTSWNYGRLFDSADDQQLSADIQLAASKVDGD